MLVVLLKALLNETEPKRAKSAWNDYDGNGLY